jgi:hypothetical protein
MLSNLINVKINWAVFFGFAVLLYLLFPALSGFSYLAFVISFYQFLLLFYSIGYVIPIRYLFGFMMCLQMLVGPAFAYNGLDKYQLPQEMMQIPEDVYFGYVIPAVSAFIIGLHISSKKLEGEIIDWDAAKNLINRYSNLPYLFIAVGFVSSVVSDFFGAEFAFVFYLLGGFKFIGAFMMIVANKKLKVLPLILVYGSIIASSLGNAMFHDLIIWLIFLAAFFAIKYKPSVLIKSVFTFSFIIAAVIIQLTKADYRMAIGVKGEDTGIETFSRAYTENKEEDALVDKNKLAKSNLRFNQGYIITHIMKTVPSKVPYAAGTELRQILEAAILPRFLAPNKLNAGDQKIFMKYTGLRINKKTSMGLSSVGDAYINFGVTGGCIFMFLLGLLYSEVLKAFRRYGLSYPVLILFIPLVFYYPIRPDCELQTILGHLVKSCFLIFVIFLVWKKYFIVYPQSAEKDIHPDTLVPSGLAS